MDGITLTPETLAGLSQGLAECLAPAIADALLTRVSESAPAHLLPVLLQDPAWLDSLLTESEAASFLGIEPATLKAWRTSGRGATDGGPAVVKFTGRVIRYRRRDLLAYAERHLVSGPAGGN